LINFRQGRKIDFLPAKQWCRTCFWLGFAYYSLRFTSHAWVLWKSLALCLCCFSFDWKSSTSSAERLKINGIKFSKVYLRWCYLWKPALKPAQVERTTFIFTRKV